MFAFVEDVPAEIKTAVIMQHILENGCPCGKCGSKSQETKDKGDRVHPLFKRIAEGDVKGIKELLSVSANPKLMLTNRVSLDLVPAKLETHARLVSMKFITPMVAAVITQHEGVLQALVDAAVELRIFAECTEGRDFVSEEEDTKKTYGAARVLWLALGKMWHKGADILFKAGSPLFPPDNRMPYVNMTTFLSKGVFPHDDVVTLSWMLKRGLPLMFGPADCRVSVFCLAAFHGANGCLMTILQEAIRRKQEPSPLNTVDPAGRSPLICAAHGGKIHTMMWLISQGADKGLDEFLKDPKADEQSVQILRDARQDYLDSLLDDVLC